MNGIEKITARIETDSKAEIAQILSEGEDKIAQIRAEYTQRIANESAQAAESAAQAAQRRQERLESAAQMDAKKLLLAAKQECLDEAFEKARKALLDLPEEKYADLLATLAKKASRTGEEEILLSSRDKQRVGKLVAEKSGLPLADETREMEGGLTLRRGNVEVNCAFETQLRVLRESMAAEIAGILFA